MEVSENGQDNVVVPQGTAAQNPDAAANQSIPDTTATPNIPSDTAAAQPRAKKVRGNKSRGNKAQGKTAGGRITGEAKKEFHEYFDKVNWTRNRKLPGNGRLPELDQIITKYGLKREQASRQLLNWKKKRYEFAGRVFSLDTDIIREIVDDHMTMEPFDFVMSAIEDMMPPNEKKSTRKKDEFSQLFCETFGDQEQGEAPSLGPEVLTLFINPELDFVDYFTTIPKGYSDLAVKCFPKTATMVDDAEFDFTLERRRNTYGGWWEDFYEIVEESRRTGYMPVACESLSKIDWRTPFLRVEEQLYFQWSTQNYEANMPPIKIALEAEVHEYSKGVLYYTAGWIVSGLHEAAGIAAKKKRYFRKLAVLHSLTKSDAETQELPTSVIDRKEIKHLYRPSKSFYEFIAHIETIFVQNLTVEMMMAYSAGNLLESIREAIVGNELMRTKFFELSGGDDDFGESISSELMDYVLIKFKHMRGRWFVKLMNGQVGGTYDAVDKASTRSGVAAKGRASKVAAAKTDNEEIENMYARVEEGVLSGEITLGDEDESAEIPDAAIIDSDSDGSIDE
jgi:hypothetical protein